LFYGEGVREESPGLGLGGAVNLPDFTLLPRYRSKMNRVSAYAHPVYDCLSNGKVYRIKVEVGRRTDCRSIKSVPSGISTVDEDSSCVVSIGGECYIDIPVFELRKYLKEKPVWEQPFNFVEAKKTRQYAYVYVSDLEKGGWLTDLLGNYWAESENNPANYST